MLLRNSYLICPSLNLNRCFRFLDMHEQASVVDKAITKTLSMDKVHTKDLGGSATSSEVMDNVIEHIKKQM